MSENTSRQIQPNQTSSPDLAIRLEPPAREMPHLVLDGECLRDTLQRLDRGSSGRSLNREALTGIVDQAQDLLAEIVTSYASKVATGEVGSGGSALASAARPIGGECPTGLLYGLIQSGKTAAMIVTTAMSIDNGFRVVIVLTSNNIKLVEQTYERFEALEGPLVYSSTVSAGGEYEWDADRGNIERHIETHGVVFICAKESRHQRALLAFLRDIGAANFPTLIFDDEADQATPDTTLAARSAQRPTAPAHASTTYRLTVENDAPAEAGESFRETLRHNVFVQVTATPYGLLLQHYDSPLRPEFTKLIEPGAGYVGGEVFFERAEQTAEPPLVYVGDNEAHNLVLGSRDVPEGLARSVAFFLLAAAAHASTRGYPDRGYKHLSHTSPRTAAHDHVAALIRTYTDELGAALASDRTSVGSRPEFQWAYTELLRTRPDAPALDVLLADVQRRIPRRRIITINAQGNEAPFGPYFNFMVGGNILGRGLTIDDLLVTYYLRTAQTTQMDTMLQHARMYGYRTELMPFTRVFLPYRLALRFHAIHQSEAALRELLDNDGPGGAVPISVINNLRPTRPGILDAGTLGTYRPGKQVFPIEPIHEPTLLGDTTPRIERALQAIGGGTVRRDGWVDISLEEMIALIEQVPVRDDDPSDWDTQAIVQVLRTIGARYNNRAKLYVRDFERSSRVLLTGGISGGEHDAARQLNVPVLFLLHEAGRRAPGERNPWSGAPFWYPTVVFPPSMPNQVFNASR